MRFLAIIKTTSYHDSILWKSQTIDESLLPRRFIGWKGIIYPDFIEEFLSPLSNIVLLLPSYVVEDHKKKNIQWCYELLMHNSTRTETIQCGELEEHEHLMML